jgi:hypothetical protein
MQTKPNKTSLPVFDAVAESRKWKESVAAMTAGMSLAERMAWFRGQSSVAAIRDRTKTSRQIRAKA